MIRRLGLGFLWGLMALLVMGLVAYWWRYGRTEKARIKIPVRANALINIDLRKMERAVFWDAIYHPFAYWDDASDDDDDDDDTPSMGISYPKRITFFMMEGADDAFFSQPIAIKSKDFQEYVDTLVRRDEWELLGQNFVFDTQKQLFYLWDASRVGVAFAKRAQADFVQTTLGDLLKEQDGDILSDDLSEKINQGEHHFVVWRKQSEWTQNEPMVLYGDFKKGSVEIQGEVPFRYSFVTKNDCLANAPTDVLGLSLNLEADKNQFEFSDSFRKNFQQWTHLELDSFLLYSAGSMSLRVPKIVTKVDSMITYEYDDDFNKIEKVTTQELVAPEILARIKSTEDSLLYNYFRRRGVVKKIAGQSRFVGFPMVEMKAVAQAQQLLLTSGSIAEKMTIDTNFLTLNISCSQYPKMFSYLPFQLDSAAVELIDRVVFSASQRPHKKISVQVKLKIKNQQRNVLGVLATMR